MYGENTQVTMHNNKKYRKIIMARMIHNLSGNKVTTLSRNTCTHVQQIMHNTQPVDNPPPDSLRESVGWSGSEITVVEQRRLSANREVREPLPPDVGKRCHSTYGHEGISQTPSNQDN